MENNKLVLTETQVNEAYEKMLDNLSKGAYNKTLEWAKAGKPKILFKVETQNMYKEYLNYFSDEIRQYYTCNTCAHFFKRFANIVYIENGELHSLYWDENLVEDEYFKNMVQNFRIKVESSRILSPFVNKPDARTMESDGREVYFYGFPITGNYDHIHMRLVVDGIKFPDKYISFESARDYFSRMIHLLYHKWNKNIIDTAIILAKSGDLNNKDILHTLESFKEIKNEVFTYSNIQFWNLIYEHIDLLDHFTNSVEGSLLDDIKNNLPLEDVVDRFNKKMDPVNYKRPKSLPASTNVEQAGKIITELGLVDSLKRKLCPLDECKTFIWKEPDKQEVQLEKEGVFSSVKTKDKVDDETKKYISLKFKEISLTSFIKNVLPEAKEIRINCPAFAHYFQYTTEAVKGSNPILRYDNIENRNPISKYTYTVASDSEKFNIKAGYNRVVAIVPECKNMISGEIKDGVLFVVENCYDTMIFKSGGLALFPEVLIRELYSVRKTIEEYSNITQLAEEPNSNTQYLAGLFYGKQGFRIELEVDTGDVVTRYIIVCIE